MNEPSRFVNKKHLNNKTGLNKEEGDPKLESCKSIDLDEIFQFSAARQRALERNAKLEQEQPFKSFFPNKVFISHLNTLNGRVIADYLREQTIGVQEQELVPEDEDENGEEGTNELELSEADAEEYSKGNESKKEKSSARQNFEIIGTVDFMKDPDYLKPESVSEILDEEDKEEFLAKLLTCGFIIYDISRTLNCHPVLIEEASWILDNIVGQLEEAQAQAPKLFKKYKDCRTFILLSTLMTWAKTKPIDPDDPSLPLTEKDYRKRKPHPNYKIHCDFEKKVLELGKKFPQNFRTIVIGSGISYGREEDVLHILFKMAWLNTPQLPLFKPGNNKLPLIHVDALANIVHLIIENFPASIRYIVAVEQSQTTLEKVVKLISKKLGSGKYVKVSKEQAFTFPEIKQRIFDMLTVNLNIIPGYVIYNMELKTNSEFTFAENIDALVTEYRESRNLKPIKIFIHGPPASGKSYLGQRLCDYYKIHHLQVKNVIEQGIEDLRDHVQELKNRGKGDKTEEEKEEELENDGNEAMNENEDTGDDEEDAEDLDTLTQFLNDIEDNMASNEKNRLDEHYVLRYIIALSLIVSVVAQKCCLSTKLKELVKVVKPEIEKNPYKKYKIEQYRIGRLFKRKMLSNPCQNQGYVIDGYPKTIEDTKILYEPDEIVEEGEENELEDDITRFYNKKIIPDLIVSLDASDEFLFKKIITMPEELVQNTHYEEEEMCRRLVQYRSLNTEENTPLLFYDELDLAPMIYNVEEQYDDFELNGTFKDLLRKIGPPRNYDPSAHLTKLQEEETKKNAAYLESVNAKSRQILQERREKMENWMFLKNQEKEMEEKALAVLAMPLRHYLMKYIFPTLTRGLVEVARVRPADPVDYLAEFLFKENPEGKMFHPNYDTIEEEIAYATKEYKMSASGEDRIERSSADNMPKSYSIDESVEPDVVSNVTDIRVKCSESSLSSKHLTDNKKELVRDGGKDAGGDGSSGSCKCAPTSFRRSESSSTSSSSTPVLPSVCKCPGYSKSGSSESDGLSSGRSIDDCDQDSLRSCKCPH